MKNTNVPDALKAVRKGAGVGLREMARRVGMPPSSYQHYEDPTRFKSAFLPLDVAEKFADALEREGVSRDSVLALSGHGPDGIDARLDRLSPERRAVMIALLEQLEIAQSQDKAP